MKKPTAEEARAAIVDAAAWSLELRSRGPLEPTAQCVLDLDWLTMLALRASDVVERALSPEEAEQLARLRQEKLEQMAAQAVDVRLKGNREVADGLLSDYGQAPRAKDPTQN